jgi:CheY-like chemotaxis protein
MVDINTVMLVDDDDICNFVTKEIVDDMGIAREVCIAMNGQQALDIISERAVNSETNGFFKPLLIFLDINMPVMDGFEFLEEFEQLDEALREQVYIVMLTSSTNDDDIQKAKLHTISGYIPKPLTEEKLKEVVDKIY